ncbi:hypothetical protein SUSAZ_06850 [Sulfolobus acidocaldarius SUSAZ]|nr:hypothetical protein SUSAZ_06850 [Sulfolobus acidocaldarius SUSAZ]
MEVYLENSSSKSGKHAIRTLLFKVEGENIVEVKEIKVKSKLNPVYKNGTRQLVIIPDKGTFIQLMFIKNVYGRVKGKAYVYNDGRTVLEMNYRKLKLKIVSGNPAYADYVRKIFEKLKIPIKRVNVKLVS